MEAVPNASSPPPSGAELHFHFLIEPEPWPHIFLRNIGDLFRPGPPQVWLTSKPGQYWADALVDRPAPWTAIRQSVFGHILTVVAVYGLTLLWIHQPRTLSDDLPSTRPIQHYQLSEYLPAVNSAPEHQRAMPPVRRHAQKADPELAPQEIVAIHEQHNSIRQTIVNPISPRLLPQDTRLPNIVAWTPLPSTAPIAPRHVLNQLPVNVPQVVPPTQQTTARNLNALQLPMQPQQIVAPAAAPVTRNLRAMNMPTPPQAAVPPSASATQRNLSDINLAMNTPAVEAPKLPAPPQQVITQPPAPAAPASAPPAIPPPPPVIAGTGKTEGQAVGQLLALNVHPAAPTATLNVPEGNRQGEFAAGPNGHSGASAQPEIAAEEKNAKNDPASAPGGRLGAGSVYVAEPPRKISPGVVVASVPSPKPDFHHIPAARTDLPGSGNVENQVFGDRHYYTMALNMPNLTSTGASWIIRFAELDPTPGAADEGLSAPVAESKVDPAYPAALMRDRVEGTVVLRAVIHSDGSVGDVRVLQSVNDDLDENARTALEKWHFRPGTKNGAPVDIEAVVRIPFRARGL
jgi:protein TonB